MRPDIAEEAGRARAVQHGEHKSRGDLILPYGGVKKTESDSLQWCSGTGQEAIRTN